VAARPTPEVVLVTALPLDDEAAAAARIDELAAIGVTRVVHGWRYVGADDFAAAADALARIGRRRSAGQA